MSLESSPGAIYLGDSRCQFVVWAPLAQRVDVHIKAPRERALPLKKDVRGYHHAVVEGVEPDSLYLYRLDNQKEHPDPASRLQPQGVHGPSQVVDSRFSWKDDYWAGPPLEDYVIYEVHVGTFTPEGTFDAIIPYLDELKELGITALELMPIAQFPGSRNWGYDGVYPFAVQNSYGKPEDIKRLVNACHQKELAVVLDVVYNHLGPEGNYLRYFGPYFTDRYRVPWGDALNFDGPDSDEVRRFFIENALYWITEFHVDALRLDALHAILDISPRSFQEELAACVHKQAERLNRRVYLIAESALNDSRLTRSPDLGGYGMDAQWNDDFHHSLHALLTGEQTGYYQDFGRLQHLVKAFQEGFVYSGEYSPYFRRKRGTSSKNIPAHRFVVFAQNHDQVGNRMQGERLSQLVSLDRLKLAAGIVLLSPFIPLIFMGEEYGETAPFQYFIDYSTPELIEAVQRGRQEEFAAFQCQGELPHPQDEATFLRSRLNHHLHKTGHHRVILEFYRELIRLRKGIPALACLSKNSMQVMGYEKSQILFVHRWSRDDEAITVFKFNSNQASTTLPIRAGQWRKRFDSEDERWCGSGSSVPEQLSSEGESTLTLPPWSFVLFTQTREA